MIPATPTGTRKVNSCLSRISLGTVWPYSRLPSPRKKSQVSTISCTSPRASAIGLPTSRVTSWASASKFASTSRPILAMTCPRTGAGVAPQAGCAAFAARKASTSCSGVASDTSATTSDRGAGLVLVTMPAAPTSGEPADAGVDAGHAGAPFSGG